MEGRVKVARMQSKRILPTYLQPIVSLILHQIAGGGLTRLFGMLNQGGRCPNKLPIISLQIIFLVKFQGKVSISIAIFAFFKVQVNSMYFWLRPQHSVASYLKEVEGKIENGPKHAKSDVQQTKKNYFVIHTEKARCMSV